MYKPHTHCRACGFARNYKANGIKAEKPDETLVPVFDLGLQPLPNAFAPPDQPQSAFYPLKVMLCPRCGLGQLSAVVPPEVMYANYAYVTSKSDTMRRHFGDLLEYMSRLRKPDAIVEIGSNDGDFLQYAKSKGTSQVAGIDPAANLAKVANEKGITTIASVFDVESAGMASQVAPCPDWVVARHVFCHVDNWRAFIESLHALCGLNTFVAIEVPHAEKMLAGCEFDTIYHEHLSYMTIGAMQALLEDSPFQLMDVKHFPIHGGSIVLVLRRRGVGKDMMLDKEEVGIDAWKKFSDEAHLRIDTMRKAVRDLVAHGHRVVGFGASAKSTVWVNACGFTKQDLAFITDTTPGKWYRLSPGTDIPITDEGALLRELPDYAVCFAWNFRKEVLEKNQSWRSKGGKFIFPAPGGVEIV